MWESIKKAFIDANIFKSIDLGDIISGIGPWLIAIAVLVIGFFVMKFAAWAVERLLKKTTFDDKIANMMGKDSSGVEKAIGKIVFWIGITYVLIIALNLAGIGKEVIEPITGMLKEFLEFLPNLIGAAFLTFATIIIATIAKGLIVNGLNAVRFDERIGSAKSLAKDKLGLDDDDIDEEDAPTPLTNAFGTIVYFLIILLLLPAILKLLNIGTISATVKTIVDDIFSYLPNIFGASILLGIGILIGNIVKTILLNFLTTVGFDALPEKVGYRFETSNGKTPSLIVASVVMITILILFIAQALEVLDLKVLSGVTDKLVPGYFNILGAIILSLIGIWVANVVYKILAPRSAIWAKCAKFLILLFTAAVALQRAQISTISSELLSSILYYAVIASAFALGVGGAIALGIGGSKTVGRFLDKKFD